MEKIQYSIVDVFSKGKYTGNPLAVFKNAGALSDREMQQIANEIHFSETTFILSDSKKDGGYDVRIFTPAEEIPFAGHRVLGTAFIIQNEIEKAPVDHLTLNLKGGHIPVSINHQENRLWMKQGEPAFGRMVDSVEMSDVLSIHKDYIDDRFPIQEVSTGLPVIVVPLKSLEAVKNVKINQEKYIALIEQLDAKAIIVFSSETYGSENDVNVRDFAPYYGIPEDAATGSSNGCLAAYLVKYRYFERREINLRSEQGYEIGRPSLLFLKAEETDEGIDVFVGGEVVKMAQGEWFLS